MDLIFLEAENTPLTKTFTRNPDGTLEKSAYPLVRNFTSILTKVEDCDQFASALKVHGERGHCLLKGLLDRPLHNESRAGHTDPLQPTTWSCFDLDNITGIDSIEWFISNVLPAPFHEADYVIQYSASSGVTSNSGVNAHVFFLHSSAFTPGQAKNFITELNLIHPLLSNQLELTAAGTALRYRLDRSVVQSDKLIYIAPPVLGEGVTSTLDPALRITAVRKKQRRVDFNWALQTPNLNIEGAVQTKVAELRERAQLPRKTARFRAVGGEQLLTNPDQAEVTGEKEARGFTYLNINGGDSWGYYYATNNPRYLRNFKGEPMVVLADFLPDYWAKVQERLTTGDRKRPFAFRHRPTDVVWNGVYDPVNERIEDLAPTTRASLPDFFTQYHVDMPAVLEDWRLEFDPTTLTQFDDKAKFCNKWTPTEFMRQATNAVPGLGSTIERVIRHVLGDDQECFDHFMNWLAFAFQKREKTGTCWVMSGTQGTGKGVLYSRILRPLFGPRYCVQKQIGSLDDRFNAETETALIYNFDEGQLATSEESRRAYARLKNWITEDTVEVRAMRANAQQVASFTNFIITSNDYDALAIEAGDRRFSVAPRQETKIQLTLEDIDTIDTELMAFAAYLQAYEVDETKARTALDNEAKRQMRDASQDWLEQMCDAVQKADLSYFMQFYQKDPPVGLDLGSWSAFNTTLERMVRGIDEEQVLTRDDLAVLYAHLAGKAMSPGKFARMLKHKNLIVKVVSFGGKSVRGWKQVWVATPEQKTEWKALFTPPPSKVAKVA